MKRILAGLSLFAVSVLPLSRYAAAEGSPTASVPWEISQDLVTRMVEVVTLNGAATEPQVRARAGALADVLAAKNEARPDPSGLAEALTAALADPAVVQAGVGEVVLAGSSGGGGNGPKGPCRNEFVQRVANCNRLIQGNKNECMRYAIDDYWLCLKTSQCHIYRSGSMLPCASSGSPSACNGQATETFELPSYGDRAKFRFTIFGSSCPQRIIVYLLKNNGPSSAPKLLINACESSETYDFDEPIWMNPYAATDRGFYRVKVVVTFADCPSCLYPSLAWTYGIVCLP